MVERPPYTVRLLSDEGTRIITSLSLTVFAGFGGTHISCTDIIASPSVAEVQNITATVFGECFCCYEQMLSVLSVLCLCLEFDISLR